MPLIQSSSKKAVAENIAELNRANRDKISPRPEDQIVAIALSIAKHKKK